MADDKWWTDKMLGVLADPENIRSMKPGDSWVSPHRAGDAKFIHEAEKVRPRGISLHNREEPESVGYAKGGLVKGCTHHVNKSCKQGWHH